MIADAHLDTILQVDRGLGSLNLPSPGLRFDLPRARAAGVRLAVFALFVHPRYRHGTATVEALRLLETFYREAEGADPSLALITDRDSLAAWDDGQGMGAVLSLEGGEPLAGSLELLHVFFRLGVRALGLTWNGRNPLADGVDETDSGGGLTTFGREVVDTLHRLGMVVDLAHLAPAGFWQALERSSRPVLVSHANSRRLCDHPRNLTDEQLRAVAQTGGVVGITLVPAFLGGPAPSMEQVIAHIEHMVTVTGPGHVALGSDFDGSDHTPSDLEDISALPRIGAALEARGYRPADVDAIMGRNLVELLQNVLPPAP